MATGDSGHEAYTAIAWGVGLSHETSDIAGAEGFHSLEGDIVAGAAARRGADALPQYEATSRAKGWHRNLGDHLAAVVGRVCARRSALGRRGAEANDARRREVGPSS